MKKIKTQHLVQTGPHTFRLKTGGDMKEKWKDKVVQTFYCESKNQAAASMFEDGLSFEDSVTRLELIDWRKGKCGRVFVSGIDPGLKVDLCFQDGCKTLKIFLHDRKK